VDHAAVIAELARRFQAGDAAGAAGLSHPAIRIQQPASLPHGGWHHGHHGIAAMSATFARLWDRAIEHPRILGCGQTVVQAGKRRRADATDGRGRALAPRDRPGYGRGGGKPQDATGENRIPLACLRSVPFLQGRRTSGGHDGHR